MVDLLVRNEEVSSLLFVLLVIVVGLSSTLAYGQTWRNGYAQYGDAAVDHNILDCSNIISQIDTLKKDSRGASFNKALTALEITEKQFGCDSLRFEKHINKGEIS